MRIVLDGLANVPHHESPSRVLRIEVAVANSENPTILITGATGNIGSELTKRLSAQSIPFRAMVRSTKSAATLATLDGTGMQPKSFDDFARDYAPAFS